MNGDDILEILKVRHGVRIRIAGLRERLTVIVIVRPHTQLQLVRGHPRSTSDVDLDLLNRRPPQARALLGELLGGATLSPHGRKGREDGRGLCVAG